MERNNSYSQKQKFFSKILLSIKSKFIGLFFFKRFDQKAYSSWKIKVVKSSILNIFKSVYIMALLILLELALKFVFFRNNFQESILLKPLFSSFENEHIFTICTALISITGIFLGLYASAISTLFSQRYLNAPDNVAKTFYDDYGTSGITEAISKFITYNLVLILSSAVKIPISLCFPFLACIPYSIFIIFSYFSYGHKDFKNTNPLVLAQHTQLQIEKYINCACSRLSFNHNPSFQKYYFRNTMNQLSILESTCYFAFSDERFIPEPNSIVNFIKTNLELLSYYESKKSQIPYNSLWFKEEQSYSKWHKSNFFNFIATNRSFPTNRFIQNHDWLEDSLEKINDYCFKKGNLNIEKYSRINFSSYLFLLARNGETNHIEKVLSQVVLQQKDKIHLNSVNENMELAEKLTLELENIIDWLSELNEVKDSFDDTLRIEVQKYIKRASDNYITNNLEIEKYKTALLIEKKIYKEILTPQYYTNQVLAKQYISFFVSLAEFLNYLLTMHLPSIKNMLAATNQKETVLFYICCASSLNTKISGAIETLSKRINEANSYRREITISWPHFDESKLLTNYNEYEVSMIIDVPTLAVQFLKDSKTNYNNFPDLAGAAFTFHAQAVLKTIKTVNLEKFALYFKDFFIIASAYSIHISGDYMKLSDNDSAIYIADAITSPIIEYGVIASFAMIIGQLTKNTQWEKVVSDSFIESLNGMNLESISDYVLRIVNMFNYNNNPRFSLNVFSTRYYKWQQEFEKAVMNMKLIHAHSDAYGHYTLDCGKDSWINSIWLGYEGLGSIFINKIYEPFVMKILNPLIIDENLRYRSNYAWK